MPVSTSARACKWLLAAIAFSAGMAAWVAPSLADRGDALELEVKATYLYKFPPFIVWPTDAFRSPASPFSLCIVGNDPFGGLIDRAVAGQRMANRRVAVVRLDAAAHDSPCQLMYIAPGSQPLQQTLKAVEGEPILTVTDSAADGSKGIINFIVRDNHVRFEIDQAAAGRNRLEISSKLLSVAVSVTPK